MEKRGKNAKKQRGKAAGKTDIRICLSRGKNRKETRKENKRLSNLLKSVTETALFFIGQYLKPGDTAVDATCGNGHDTAALAQMGAGNIYGFDIQKQALDNTEARLRELGFLREGSGTDIRLILDSHENLGKYIAEPVKVAVFNLGYLPSADKSVTTGADSTVRAVKQLLELLQKDGLICITMYSGHPGGQEEKDALLRLGASLDKRKYHAAYLNFVNQPDAPPELLMITAKK